MPREAHAYATRSHTQPAFAVRNLEAEVADLRSRGVTFEECDAEDDK